MRGLFTADLQAEWANLGLCTKIWNHLVTYAIEHELEFICLCGDIKRQYNPVDMRVNLWAQRKIEYARRKGLRVMAVNGNHDRIGQYDDQQNWMPILQRAGAEVFDEPAWVDVDGGRLAILPFCTDVEKLKRQAWKLSRKATKDDVLVFHTDLKNCSYNITGARSESTFRVADLYPSRYKVCLGGHVHLPQRLGENTYYVGSPFATDWGEANQRKSFMVVSDVGVKTVPSKIPGWYDEQWPGFKAASRGLEDWTGANIRIHVSVPLGADYNSILTRSREATECRYPGAVVHTVAEFEERDQVDGNVCVTDPDKVKIIQYVRAQEYEDEGSMVQYLVNQLEKVGGGRRAISNVRFLTTCAKNFLSFENVKLKFEKGITVVQGVNKDRGGCSNGSGKTSLLSMIPVALFGTTFKGQKYDRWARRGASETAEVQVAFRDSRKRQIRVVRSRNPTRLRLEIGGADHSSGLRGDTKEATAGFIEQVSGYTWQTLANSVFIDQEVTRTFLAGTKKQRTDLLSRFQNLERFEEALKWVRADKNENYKRLVEMDAELGQTKILIERYEEECEQLGNRHSADLKELQTAIKKIESELEQAVIKLESVATVRSKKVKRLESQCISLNQEVGAFDKSLAEINFEKKEISVWLTDAGHLYKDKTCPTCYQRLDHGLLEQMKKKWSAKLGVLSHNAGLILSARAKLLKKVMLLERKIEEIEQRTIDQKSEIRMLETKKDFEHRRMVAFHNESVDEGNALKKKQKELKELRRKLYVDGKVESRLKANEQFYGFAERALGRDGIPAFLNKALVPVLNKAAQYYSELFTEKELQVVFDWDGEFEIKILNASGGEDFEAQSKGEKAMAGLVTAFAARETASASNLLVLDEPGDGLDPVTARKFARGLKGLAKRFDSIYIMTYNDHILAELSAERTLMVEKKKGVSRLVGSV